MISQSALMPIEDLADPELTIVERTENKSCESLLHRKLR